MSSQKCGFSRHIKEMDILMKKMKNASERGAITEMGLIGNEACAIVDSAYESALLLYEVGLDVLRKCTGEVDRKVLMGLESTLRSFGTALVQLSNSQIQGKYYFPKINGEVTG